MNSQPHALIPPILLTEQQAAKILQVHPRTLKRARGQGALPYVRIGKCVRYRIDDIEQFIARSSVKNDCEAPSPQRKRVRPCSPPAGAIIPFSKLVA